MVGSDSVQSRDPEWPSGAWLCSRNMRWVVTELDPIDPTQQAAEKRVHGDLVEAETRGS